MVWGVHTGNVFTHRKCVEVYTQEMGWGVHTGNVDTCI